MDENKEWLIKASLRSALGWIEKDKWKLAQVNVEHAREAMEQILGELPEGPQRSELIAKERGWDE